MRTDERQHEQHFGDEVTVAGHVEGVAGDRAEAQRLLEQHPVHGESRAGERARAERQLGHTAAGVGEALAVAHQRPGVGEQHVAPAHGLGPLAVGVPGEQDVDALLRLLDEHAAHGGEVGVELIDGVEGPEPQIGGHLVVAGAAGVELARRGADFFVEQALDERMDVLIGGAGRGAVGEPLGDAVEAVEQLGFLFSRQHADAAEGVNPRLAGGDVLRPEPVIHRETAVQGVERFGGPEREAATPHLVGGSRGLHSASAPTWGRRCASSPAAILIARP